MALVPAGCASNSSTVGISPATARAHEEALRTSEERFRLLVDSVDDHAIFMLDPAGLVQSWNKPAENILGYPASAIMGRHLALVVPAADREAGQPTATLDGATRHGRIEEEGWRMRQDGSRFWAKSVTTAVYGRSGDLLGFAVVCRTDRSSGGWKTWSNRAAA